MKPGDAILTIGLVALGLFSVWWILQQHQAQQQASAVNDAASINVGELANAALVAQFESFYNAQSTTNSPVTTSPAAVVPAHASSGQQ